MNYTKQTIHTIIFALLLIFFSGRILYATSELVNHTLLISLFPCLFAFFLIKNGKIKKPGRAVFTATLLLTLLFLIMLSAAEIVNSQLFARGGMAFLYLALVAFSSFLTIQFSLEKFSMEVEMLLLPASFFCKPRPPHKGDLIAKPENTCTNTEFNML